MTQPLVYSREAQEQAEQEERAEQERRQKQQRGYEERRREYKERAVELMEAKEPAELVFEYDPQELDEEDAQALADQLTAEIAEVERLEGGLRRRLTKREEDAVTAALANGEPDATAALADHYERIGRKAPDLSNKDERVKHAAEIMRDGPEHYIEQQEEPRVDPYTGKRIEPEAEPEPEPDTPLWQQIDWYGDDE